MLDTDMIKGLKDTINLNEDTPAEELFDKAVQGIEFTGLGYAFNKLYPMIKAMRKVDVQKAATVTAGSLAAGEGAKAIVKVLRKSKKRQYTKQYYFRTNRKRVINKYPQIFVFSIIGI